MGNLYGLLVTLTPFGILLGLLAVALIGLYRHFTKHYDSWAWQGVPYKKPVFPYGSLKELTLSKVRLGEAYDRVYYEFQNEPYFGVVELNQPVLVIKDPELIRRVLIKDFNHFVDRDAFEYNPREFINNHLSSMRGDKWKKMRHQLAPAFSSKKIKLMHNLMLKVSDLLTESLHQLIDQQQSINIKELLSKFSMDIISSCAFGIETNSLADQNNKFYQNCKSMFRGSMKKAVIRKVLALFPSLARALNLRRVPEETVKMMFSIISNTVKYREENNFTRGDFLDILIRLRQNKSISDDFDEELKQADNSINSDSTTTSTEGLSLEDMTAHAFIFFAAGYETSSSSMSCALYEMARNPDVQQRLSWEVDEVLQRYGGKLTYEAIQEMKYMDQVINETFRMYPTAGIIHRRCTQDYPVPNSKLVLSKGQKVCIPVNAIHHDPKYYPDPYKFDPERFSPDKTGSRPPCVHLPFGDGPRSCIGIRFGMMQTKTGLATILSKFKVDVAPNTPKSLEFEISSIITVPKSLFLKISKKQDITV